MPSKASPATTDTFTIATTNRWSTWISIAVAIVVSFMSDVARILKSVFLLPWSARAAVTLPSGLEYGSRWRVP